MAGTSICLSITLNVNGQNSPIKRWTGCFGLKTKTQLLLPERNSPHWQRHTQAEGERMENDIPTKRKMKASRSIYSYI
jgi:hypothetical protein